ncbi:MAG: M3 family oligoendopeptidase [Caldisericia bacterium]|nr:M3 family oligoendopeptidase [Caldisericia bacterium]
MKTTGAENIVWNLSGLYKNLQDPSINEDIESVEKEVKKIQTSYRNRIKNNKISAKELKDLFETMEKSIGLLYNIGSFSHLVLCTDNSNEEAKSFSMKFDEISTNISNQLIFIGIELKDLDQKAFNAFVNDPELAKYKHYLLHNRAESSHLLSEAEEAIMAMKNNTGRSALQRLYSELASSFKYEITIDGEKKILNGSEIGSLRMSPDNKIRHEAAKVRMEKFEDNSLVIGNVYNSLLKDKQVTDKIRSYENAYDAKNLTNELSSSTVDTLSKVTCDNTGLVQRYYKLKAKLMNTKKLSLDDIYCPLKKVEKQYSWDQAKDIVLTSYKSFDEVPYKMIKQFFDNDWIHAKLLPNKTGGAFCMSSTPGEHPYVMINFTGNRRDIETLAHELGHGFHGMISGNQTLFNYHPIMPMAEIASVFGEMLVTQHFLNTMKSDEEKISLLCSKLESAFATTFRQNMFHRFELRTHDLIRSQSIPLDTLKKIYTEELEKMFGDSVIIPEYFNMEWAMVHHIFHYPFYVYAYNFAQLVVLALYKEYLNTGEAFKPLYFDILSSGSSKSPTEILSKANINLEDANFWQQGFDFINDTWLNQLEELAR